MDNENLMTDRGAHDTENSRRSELWALVSASVSLDSVMAREQGTPQQVTDRDARDH